MKKIQLSISTPCHENWEAMKPEEKGRFCNPCQKTVVDFSQMSDRQIAEFFKKPAGSTCGRFHAQQLNRDIALPKKRLPWLRYFFQFSLPAFLVSAKASAQGKVVMTGDTVCVSPDIAKKSLEIKNTGANELKGIVIDADGNPIPGASVMIEGGLKGVATNEKGEFKLFIESKKNLQISCVGFTSQTIVLKDFSELRIVMQPAVLEMSGVIFVTRNVKRKKVSMPLIKSVSDTAFKHFAVFPNPASGHARLTIDFKNLEKGNYVLSIIDMNGEVLETNDAVIDEKKKRFDFYLNDLKAGTYVVHLFNRRTAASFSEKIIVQ